MMNRQQLDWELVGDSMVKVTGQCKFTGDDYSCVVPVDGFARFMKGEHAQTAMPSVSADDREFLISGISPAGWKKTFG